EHSIETAIGNAMGPGVLGLMDSNSQSRVILLITDGDERGGNISAVDAARDAAAEGIQVYPILVGRPGQVLIPEQYGSVVRYQTSDNSNVNPELLQDVARITGGEFFRASDREELETTLDGIIDDYEKDKFEDLIHIEREDVYDPFAWAGFLLLGLDLLFRYALVRRFP
ncbi:MAG: VWA domain-containing protein, partial [Myxococcales bacterium]|nr:VWA domain-containing protein [Myxococcales bacterium]